jgi:hypothetical protein
VDNFVLAKLESEKLKPAPEADKVTLLRRLSLDLIGLPPTIAEVDDFLADKSKDAYEKQVERLLASPHYGERWGRHWLDVARYAETVGRGRNYIMPFAWRYRDYVIDSFNKDKPYDQFVKEQIAGDLLPQPAIDDLVASACQRLTQANDEGGTDDEEFRVVIPKSMLRWDKERKGYGKRTSAI